VRFVVFGAGAVGGVVGGRLAQSGHDVLLIARGAHYEAMRDRGLRLVSHDEDVTIRIPATDHPAHAGITADDVVLLTLKSHDTRDAVRALSDAAPRQVRVVCAQNGVANERMALRAFPNVYGANVMCPALHLEPGVVEASSAHTTGMIDLGRFPAGADEDAERIAAALRVSTFDSRVFDDIMRWKYTKLVMNLGNAIEAACGPAERGGELYGLAHAEAEACLRAAGIERVSDDEFRSRRGDILDVKPVAGRERSGASSWQSLARGTGAIETDYLNGEIVLLGRLHGVPTPANELLQEVANRMAHERRPPGSMRVEELLARLSSSPR